MFELDPHTHSLASGHAGNNTITDLAKQAAYVGLKALGLTDHGPATPGSSRVSYFRNLAYAPKKRCGIEFLYGVELNITDFNGSVDLDDEILEKLLALGCKNVIFTGISYAPGKTGIVVLENGNYAYYEHELLPNSCHGTGDIYASAFVGAFVRGKSAYDAAAIAANYTMECIRYTATLHNHWYGAAFEPVLGKLIDSLK
jgi:hypothetical protein